VQANICFREHLVKDTISTFLQVVLSTHKVKVSLHSKLLVSEVEDKLSEPECTDLKNKKMARLTETRMHLSQYSLLLHVRICRGNGASISLIELILQVCSYFGSLLYAK
jgi:hypothetical protein